MENIKFTNKQIANWRRIAQNVYSDYVKRDKITKKIMELQEELKTVNQMIEIQEYPVKAATGGYTTQDIFVKEVIVNDKVAADGRTLKKSVYNLRYPTTVLPPCDGCAEMPEAELHTDMDNTDII